MYVKVKIFEAFKTRDYKLYIFRPIWQCMLN